MRNRSCTWQKRSSSWLYLLVWLSVLLGSQYGFGQANVPLGSWQVHVPYQQGRAVADAGDKVYVAAERGLFYYDKEFNTTETITKVDGLREQQISSIAYDKATQTLVIAYANTNIDLLQGSKVINISDVFRKAIPGEKSIHAITIHDKQAYLASSFGVVVLDLVKREVKDTYSNLGPGGEAVRVRATAILRDSIYLATDPGVLAAQRSGYNLQDFRSWSNLSTALPAAPTGLAVFNGRLYASTADNIYTLSGGSWRNTALVEATTINSIHASEKHLAVATASGISLWHQNGTVSRLSHQLLTDPRQATVGAEGTVWVADGKKGLVKMRPDGTQAETVSPDGPYTSNSFRVYAHVGKVYVLSGGYNENYVPNNLRDGFYTYAGGEWQSYNQELYPGAAFTQAKDLVDATYNPVTEKLYLASYGNGLVEWEQLGKGQLYNGTNSTLLSTLGGADKTEQVRLTGVAVDPEGNVWVVNRNQLANEPGLHMLRLDGNWESFLLPGVADGSNLEHLLLDDAGHKWLSIARSGNRRSGLVVFDDKENRVRYLSTGEGNGDLPNGAVYAMAKDLNGDIWVGTASGVGVYYNPAFV
ncbi:MAG: hypothetical protein LPK09_14540, partial [Hymenobacteraceae bacterium]|nr:hypothetical protein [Hymenobacteraceae bacterium]